MAKSRRGAGVAVRRMHERVVALLTREPPGRVLDIPAGAAPVRERLRRHGHQVVEVDLFPRRPFQGVRADACAPLPFAARYFDAVLSMEGIEHFENQAAFLRECARVLRPGGLLVLTTPNVLHLSSRLSYVWTGQRLTRQGFINEVTTLRGRDGERLHHGHAFLIDAFRLRYLLAVSGLRLQRLWWGNFSSGSFVLAPLLPLLWAAAAYAVWSGRRHRRKRGQSVADPQVEAELLRLARAPALLFSRTLIVEARKPLARP